MRTISEVWPWFITLVACAYCALHIWYAHKVERQLEHCMEKWSKALDCWREAVAHAAKSVEIAQSANDTTRDVLRRIHPTPAKEGEGA